MHTQDTCGLDFGGLTCFPRWGMQVVMEWGPLLLPLLLLASSSESLESEYEESDSSIIQDPSPNFPTLVEDEGPPMLLVAANDDATVVYLAPPLSFPLGAE